MDHQTQFNLSHILGQAVDVANYSTFQHQLHSYGNLSTVGNITSLGGTTVAPTAQSVTVQDVTTPGGPIAGAPGMVTMGYAHPQSAPAQSYHAVFNNMTVTHVTPQMPPTQVQYFSYEAPSMNMRTQSLHTHHPHQAPPQPSNPQGQVKYGNCSLSIQAVNTTVPLNCSLSLSRGRTGKSTTIKGLEITPEKNCVKKRRVRKEGISVKLDRKKRRNRGEAYVNAAGKLVEAKRYVERDCQCKNKCLSKLGTVTDREHIFKQFWDIGDFAQQNTYLTENVILIPNVTKRRKAPLPDDKNLKTVTRLYYVRLSNCGKQIRICKSMFLNLHGVSNGRLDRVLQAVSCEYPEALQDRRGQHTPSNKTSEDDINFVIRHILSLKHMSKESVCIFSDNQLQGLHQSHISSEVNGTGGKELSVKKMYELYKRVCQEEGRAPVSLWVYRQTEKSKVNQENSSRNDAATKNRDYTDPKTQTVSNTIEHRPLTNNSNLYNSAAPEIQEHIIDLENKSVASNTRRRKRVGDCRVMSRKERKAKRNSGAAYFTASGKLKEEKFYIDKECGCKYRCIPEQGTHESRKRIFDSFWKLADFTRQNTYIAQKVVLVPIMQKDGEKVVEKFTRTYTRIYNIQLKPGEEPVRVCKNAFLQLHGLSNGRVDRVLQAVACQSPFALKDRRGHHSPKNKTQEEDIDYACCHIRSFPIESCNSEITGTNRLFLPHNLNVEKMYRMYKEQCSRDKRIPIGSFVYRKILKERFNCVIKSPANKTPEKDLEYAYQHIQSCTTVTVHQKDDPGIQPNQSGTIQETSVKKLHKVYVDKCIQEGKKPVGIDVYRKIFNSKFHLKQDLKHLMYQS
ncbi:uncharacterized protein [Panulirus ornatus]|uniref:uncharacterized protein n=1 Tax=Panulirus ornatus TaxID=150431 RepID=UPI003A83D2A9